MPRFVLLRHDCPSDGPTPSHWDFMLEGDGALRTWRLPQILRPGQSYRVERLADHRIAYLDFEGELGGARGRVEQVDAGNFAWLEESADRLEVRLEGRALRGVLTLTREQPLDDGRWSIELAGFDAESTGSRG